MGVLDAILPDTKIEIKFADLMKLTRTAVQAEFVMNGVINHVPYEHIVATARGTGDRLKAYEDTNLNPFELKEQFDKLAAYADLNIPLEEMKCLKDEKDQLEKENCVLREKVDMYQKALSPIPNADASDQTADPDSEPKHSKDYVNDIIDLKEKGWKVKDIAEHLGLKPATVSNVLWKYNKECKETSMPED